MDKKSSYVTCRKKNYKVSFFYTEEQEKKKKELSIKKTQENIDIATLNNSDLDNEQILLLAFLKREIETREIIEKIEDCIELTRDVLEV